MNFFREIGPLMLGYWLGRRHSVLHNGIEGIFAATRGKDY